MGKRILYHGSSEIIEKPVYGKGKLYNDYGSGFYCTEHIELAKEWACTEGIDGYANKYELVSDNLSILNLLDKKYNILHWLTLLVMYRKITLTTPMMKRSVEWLKKNFFIDIDNFDVIIGYRADDSYFSFARAFLNNEISFEQLNYAMKLGKLGEQVVLKSEKAFSRIRYLSCESADNSIYYARRKARDDKARNDYFTELEKEDLNGLYIRDIIRKERVLDELRL